MRTGLRQQARQSENRQVLGGDVQDGLAQPAQLEDAEAAAELAMTRQQLEALKRRLARGR